MVLSDSAIRSRMLAGDIKISHMNHDYAVQPASVDVRLGCSFAIPDYEKIARSGSCVSLDTRLPYMHKTVDMTDTNTETRGFVLEPKSFVLASTLEYLVVPDNLSARVDGRSSIGRLGLFIQNAGWIDPGFEGEITLELFNALNVPILLVPGRRIGQLIFHTIEGDVESPYRGKYQGQRGATGSRIFEDHEAQ